MPPPDAAVVEGDTMVLEGTGGGGGGGDGGGGDGGDGGGGGEAACKATLTPVTEALDVSMPERYEDELVRLDMEEEVSFAETASPFCPSGMTTSTAAVVPPAPLLITTTSMSSTFADKACEMLERNSSRSLLSPSALNGSSG